MNAKEFYEFQLNDRTSVVGRQDKDEIIMLMEEYYMYKVKTCNKPAVSESVEPVREGTVCPECRGQKRVQDEWDELIKCPTCNGKGQTGR